MSRNSPNMRKLSVAKYRSFIVAKLSCHGKFVLYGNMVRNFNMKKYSTNWTYSLNVDSNQYSMPIWKKFLTLCYRNGFFQTLCSKYIAYHSNKLNVSVFTPESILSSPVASSLSTLPFQMLRILFQGSELVPQEGEAVHRAAMEVGAIQMVLLCLAVLSHHKPRATNHSHKLALQALSALTGRYCGNVQIMGVFFPNCLFQARLHLI